MGLYAEIEEEKNMRRIVLGLLFIAVMELTAIAQTVTFRPGDMVQAPDGRTGKIESVSAEIAKVRYGPGPGETQFYMLTTLKIVKDPRSGPVETFHVGDLVMVPKDGCQSWGCPEYRIKSIKGEKASVISTLKGSWQEQEKPLESLTAAVTPEQKLTRAAFLDEAKPYDRTVKQFAHAYDPKFQDNTALNFELADLEKWRKDLEALNVICQKYPNLRNDPTSMAFSPDRIDSFPTEWCKMGEQSGTLVKKMKMSDLSFRLEQDFSRWKLEIDQAMRNQSGNIEDDLQKLVYDRNAWEQKALERIRKTFAAAGEQIPRENLSPLYEKADELKAFIEKGAETRSWKQPEYTDAGLQAMAKGAYPSSFPGSVVYKIGMTFATWKLENDTSYVGSSADYNFYRTTIGISRYKRGLALVKMPNQPLCQIRDFTIYQKKAGGGYGASQVLRPLGDRGVFVKCP